MGQDDLFNGEEDRKKKNGIFINDNLLRQGQVENSPHNKVDPSP